MTQPISGTQFGISQIQKNPITEYFKRTVRDSGITLVSTDGPNLLTQEQALVGRDIEKLLEKDASDENIDKFIRGFKVLIKKEKYLTKALLPTVFRKSGTAARPQNIEIQQESLFR